MARDGQQTGEAGNDPAILLDLLTAVERDEAQTQRSLSGEMGVALGLANAYLRRCVRKGWIKVREAPARRFLYYVTPTGFAEKARLTAEYLSASFDLFRTARGQCDALIEQCQQRGWRRVALVGIGDLAEIAALSALGSDVEIVAVVAPGPSNQTHIAALPVVATLAAAGPVDAVILTDIRTPQATWEALAETVAPERLLVPAMLRVTRRRVSAESAA